MYVDIDGARIETMRAFGDSYMIYSREWEGTQIDKEVAEKHFGDCIDMLVRKYI